MKKCFTYKELRTFILKVLKLKFTRCSKSSHEIYTGMFKEKERVVTLDVNHDKFSERMQKNNLSSMIKQMGFDSKSEFLKLYEK